MIIRPEALRLNEDQWTRWKELTGSFFNVYDGPIATLLQHVGIPKHHPDIELSKDEQDLFTIIEFCRNRPSRYEALTSGVRPASGLLQSV